jgi:flagellar hook-associated protein 3 FlgL
VSFETDHLVISSDQYGAESSVEVTGGSARSALGFAGGSVSTGAAPFALTVSTGAATGNSGGAVIAAGRIADESLVTFDDYLVRFNSPSAYDVLDVTVPPTVVTGNANSGAASVVDAGIADPAQLTLHTYRVQFTSATQYSVVDTTTSTTLSSGNNYVSGNPITFDGLRVVVANGDRGGPQAGDQFTVSLAPRTVLANQTYVSGSEINFEGIQVAVANTTGSPAAGDLFSVVTGIQYQGDNGVHSIEVGNDQTVATNVSGDRMFTPASANLFATVKGLVTSLRTNERAGIAQSLGGIDRSFSAIGAVHGEVGALSNRLTTSSAQLVDAKGFWAETLSKNEDVDLAKAISDLTLQQFALEAASQTLSRVFENSLLKYL